MLIRARSVAESYHEFTHIAGANDGNVSSFLWAVVVFCVRRTQFVIKAIRLSSVHAFDLELVP